MDWVRCTGRECKGGGAKVGWDSQGECTGLGSAQVVGRTCGGTQSAERARPGAALPASPAFRSPSTCPFFLSLPPRRLSPPSQTPPYGSRYTSPQRLGAPGTQLSRHQRHLPPATPAPPVSQPLKRADPLTRTRTCAQRPPPASRGGSGPAQEAGLLRTGHAQEAGMRSRAWSLKTADAIAEQDRAGGIFCLQTSFRGY